MKDSPVKPLFDYVDGLETQNDALSTQLAAQTSAIAQLTSQDAQQTAQIDALTKQQTAQRIIGVALCWDFLNVPYVFGAEWENNKAFDCSSFTQKCFSIVGIKIPRTSREQATAGTSVPLDRIQVGDLLFYDFNHDGKISHVGICMGDGKMIHTNTPATGINIVDIATWNNGSLVAARRFI